MSTTRPARMLGFDHTGLAVQSFADALPLDGGVLGGEEIGRGHSQRFGLRWLQLRYPNGNVLELVEPDGPESPLQKFLAERGEGVHHLTFITDDIGITVSSLRESGRRVVGEDDSNPRWKAAHVSPRSANGTVVQVAEGTDAVADLHTVPDWLRERARALLTTTAPEGRQVVLSVLRDLDLIPGQAPSPGDADPLAARGAPG